MAKTSTKRRQRLTTGPFKGVFATREPYDVDPRLLVDAKNGYVPDPANGSGWYARPNWRSLNGGQPVYTTSSPFRTQCIYTHTMLDGSTINFLFIGGQLFRVSGDQDTYTNVTPGGVTIDPGVTTRAFACSLIGTLTVNDGVNRPWVATNLTSTPITGTYIDYDGHGVSWTMYGAPRVYAGSVFGILNSVNGISRRADISWSASGDPTTGWQQAIYDNNWTLSQNEAGLLYALESDNLALRYFRESSIGAASGTDTTNLASTATDDAVSFNVGAQASQTIQKVGNGFFFLDALGRPYWFEPGAPPEPIWQQMRIFVEEGTANNPTTTAIVATSALEPVFNLYIVAIWSPSPSSQAAPVEMHVFDAHTRIYQGRWSVSTDLPIECLGTWQDSAGRQTLIAATEGGYLWSLSPLGIQAGTRVTQNLNRRVTQSGAVRTTEGGPTVWQDDSAAQEVFATSDRMGFDEDTVWNIDTATIITSTAVPIELTISSAGQSDTVQAMPNPNPSHDNSFRTVIGCNAFGRGPQATVAPIAFSEQFILQRISVTAVASLASWEDN